MELRDCRKCFHHVDRSGESVVCRFWGGNYMRSISSEGASAVVIACPRKSL